MYKNFLRIFMFMLVIMLVACSSETTIVQAPATATPTTASRPTKTPFESIPIPTLSSDVQDELYDLLKGNGAGCELPCFLGITPHQTSLETAKTILEKFDINKNISRDDQASSKDYDIYSAHIMSNKDIDMSITISLEVKDELVERLVVGFNTSRNGMLVRDDHHLARYSLSEVFKSHGIPESIYFKGPKVGVYTIISIYQDERIVISLTGRAKEVSDTYEVCPNLGDGDIDTMTIALSSSTDATDVRTLLGYQFWQGVPPFKEATGLSIDDFYQLMIGNKHPACFETK